MKLYLLTQDDNTGYDTYDSCVVAAKNRGDAINMHPSGKSPGTGRDDIHNSGWTTPDKVSAYEIGTARAGTQAGVICASFNAG